MELSENTKIKMFKEAIDLILQHDTTRVMPDKDGKLMYANQSSNNTMEFGEFLKQVKSAVDDL